MEIRYVSKLINIVAQLKNHILVSKSNKQRHKYKNGKTQMLNIQTDR